MHHGPSLRPTLFHTTHADAHFAVVAAMAAYRLFVRLLAVYLLNGIASAIPATLVLFFVQDRLQGGAALQSRRAWELTLHVARCPCRCGCGWSRHAGAWHAPGCAGMLLVDCWFLWVPVKLGATGMPMVLCWCAPCRQRRWAAIWLLPGALLAGVIAEAGDRGRLDASYFGWWNFATKLNLALAAGL
jgi:GPH family glycoside/pentoside/hexuronide:cation symporter